MALCLYGTKEPGYQALDLDELSNEQAVAIGDMIHRVALDYLQLDYAFHMSTRLQRVLFQYIEPHVMTVRDLRLKPLSDWRKHPFVDKHIYTELRDSAREVHLYLPAWEMLP